MKMIKKVLVTLLISSFASVVGFSQTTCTAIPANAPTPLRPNSFTDLATFSISGGNWILNAKTPTVTVGTLDASGLKAAANIFVQSGEKLSISAFIASTLNLNIYVLKGGVLEFPQATTLPTNVSIYNYGNVNVTKGDLTLAGNLYNAAFSQFDASANALILSGAGTIVNNGVILLNDLQLNQRASGAVCVGPNSCITTVNFSSNSTASSIQPNFDSTTDFGNINITGTASAFKNPITSSSSVQVCLAKGATDLSKGTNWVNATVITVTSPFCAKGLTELIDPNPVLVNTICYGTIPTISIKPATGFNGLKYSYQWQSSPDTNARLVVWTDIPGATGQTYTPASAITQTTFLRRKVTSVFTAYSRAIVINVTEQNRIVSNNQVICFGMNAYAFADLTFSQVAKYQWLSSNSIKGSWNQIAGATLPTYDPNPINATTYFRRIMSTGTVCSTDTTIDIITVEVKNQSPFLVTSTDDNTDFVGCGMLRFAIDTANKSQNVETIRFDPSVFKSTNSNQIVLETRLNISKNVKIIGPGKKVLEIISPKSSAIDFGCRICRQEALTATGTSYITGMTFSGANGGAVNFSLANSDLVVRGCDFVGNSAYDGGGLNFSSSGLIIDSCTFDGNVCTLNGNGAPGNGAGAYINASGNVLIQNSKFLNNSRAGNGGGVYLSGNFTDAKFSNCSFVKDSANNGGGLAIDLNATGKIDVIYSTFSRNFSTSGGGIYSNADFTLSNSTVSENIATSSGGGVEVMTGAFSFIDNIIAGNTPTTSNGRDLHIYKGKATSNGYNLIGVSDDMTGGGVPIWDKTNDILGTAKLPVSPKLQNLDQTTFTYTPLIGSPVIDKGIVYAGMPATDQLGAKSVQGKTVDIGSVETTPFVFTAGNDTTICDSNTTLSGTPIPTNLKGYTGVWNITSKNVKLVQSGSVAKIGFLVVKTVADSAKFVWSLKDPSGVIVISDTVKVVKKATPPAPTVTTPVYECLGVTPTKALTINNPTKTDTLLWYSAAFPKGTTSIIPATTKVDSIPYFVTRIAKGCESARSTIYVSTKAQPNTNLTVIGSVLCSNSKSGTATIAGTTKGDTCRAYIGTKPVSVLALANGINPTILNLPPAGLAVGDNIVSVKISNLGCSNFQVLDTAKVVMNSLPSATQIVSATSPVCKDDSTQLSISKAETGVKYFIYDGGIKIDSFPLAAVTKKVNMNLVGTRTLSVKASIAGCATVNLTNTPRVIVNPLPATPLIRSNSPICSGADLRFLTDSVKSATYAWSGVKSYVSTLQNPIIKAATVLDSGIYILVVKDTLTKCSSIGGKIRVVVNPTPNSPSAIQGVNAICLGDSTIYSVTPVTGLTYSWTYPNKTVKIAGTGNTIKLKPTQSGTLEVIAATSTCISIAASKSIIVNPLPAIPEISSNSPVCAGATLSFFISPAKNTIYSWTGPNGFLSSSQNPSIKSTVAATGTYSLVLKDTTTKCSSKAVAASVQINPKPATPTITGTCVSSTPPVTLGSDYSKDITKTSTWFRDKTSVGKGGSFIVRQTGGIYRVLVSDTLTKCASDTSLGVDSFVTTPKISISGTSPFCTGDSLKVSSSSPAGSNSWVLGGNKISSTAQTIFIKSAGMLVLQVTSGNCPGKDSSKIATIATPAKPVITSVSDSLCPGKTLKLSTLSKGNLQWFLNGAKIGNATKDSLIVNKAGIYHVRDTSGICTAVSAVKNVGERVSPQKPTLNLTGTQSICQGANLMLSIVNYVSSQDQWYISGNVSNKTQSLSATAAGNYKVIRTTAGGCTAVSDSVILNVKICANAGRDTSICASVYKLNATPNANYQTAWRVVSGKGVFSDSTATATVSGLASGVNKFVWLLKSNGVIVGRDTVQISSTKANAGLDRKVFADTVNLKGNVVQGATSAWRKISSTTIISTNTSFNTKLSVGNNLFEYGLMVPNVCVSKDSVLVKYVIKDTANAGDDVYACTDNATLGATKPKTGNRGKWTFVNKKAHTINIANDTLFNSKISGISVAKDTLLWTVTSLVDNTIFSVDTLIVYNAKVTVTITKPSTAQNVAVTQKSVVLSAKVVSSLSSNSNWRMNNTPINVDSLNPYLLTQKVNGFKVFVNDEFCSAEDSLTITLVDTTKAYAGVDQEIYVDSTLLTAFQPVKGYHGIWSKLGSSSVIIVNDTLYNTKLKNIPFGKTTLVWTLTSPLGIQTKDTIVINRVPLKILSTVIQPVCTQANGKVLISLSPKNGLDTFTGDLVKDSTSGLLPKTYKVRIFRNGKPAKDTLFELKAVNPYKLTLSSKDTSFCAGGSPVLIKGKLNPSASATYKWSGPKTSFADSVIASDSGKYVLSATVSGCVLKDSVKVRVISAPKANAGLDRKVFADTVNLKGNAVQGATPAWRKIPTTTTFSNTANANARISLGLNTFEYSLTVPNNCTSRDSVRITYVIKDTARAGNDIYACADTSILKATKPKTANKGKWTFVGKNSGALTIANDTLFNSKISGISAGNGVLLWTVTSLIDSTTRSVDTLKIFNAKVTVAITKPTSAPDIALTQKTISLVETVVSAFPATSTWYRNDTLQTIVPSTFAKNVTVFKVKVANKYCAASDSLTATLVDTTKAYAGPDQEIYVDSTLSGALKPANGYNGTWSKEINSTIVIVDKDVYNTKFKNIPFGISTLVWTLVSPNAITTRDTLVIVRKKLTVEAVVTQPVCIQANGTISIQIKELSNYLDTFVGDTLKGATTIGLGPKSYKVRIFRNGKPVKDTSFVLKAVNPYKLTLSSKDTSFCTGLSLTIKGKITPSIFATYKWSGPKISSADSVIVSDSGKYVLTTTASGCVLKDSVKVRLFPSPKAFAGNDTLTCQSTAKLKAGSLKQGEKGTWSKLFGTSILSANNIPNPTVTFLSKYDSTKGKETNRYVWSVSDQNQRCTTHDTVDVYYAVVLISVEDDTSGIAGQEIALKVTQNDKYALGDKLIVTALNTKIGEGQPILAYDVQNLTVVFKTNPRYYVKEPYRFGYIISNACQARDTGYVVLNKTTNDPPTAHMFTKSTESGAVYTFVLNFSEIDKNPNISFAKIERSLHGFSTATFSPDSSQLTIKVDYSAVPEFAGLDTLLLRVCDVNELGIDSCVYETFIIDVVSKNNLGLVFYNGLSKNEDGKNDIFYIENAEKFPDNSLKILNRWGDLVYSAKEYNNKDVVFDGGSLPDGTYYYFFDPGNGLKMVKGFILLKR